MSSATVFTYKITPITKRLKVLCHIFLAKCFIIIITYQWKIQIQLYVFPLFPLSLSYLVPCSQNPNSALWTLRAMKSFFAYAKVQYQFQRRNASCNYPVVDVGPNYNIKSVLFLVTMQVKKNLICRCFHLFVVIFKFLVSAPSL